MPETLSNPAAAPVAALPPTRTAIAGRRPRWSCDAIECQACAAGVPHTWEQHWEGRSMLARVRSQSRAIFQRMQRKQEERQWPEWAEPAEVA